MSALELEVRPHVEIVDGQLVTNSFKIAEHFGKIHRDVVRAIDDLDCSPEFRVRNFAQSSASVPMPRGGVRQIKAYSITRDGFTFLDQDFLVSQNREIKTVARRRACCRPTAQYRMRTVLTPAPGICQSDSAAPHWAAGFGSPRTGAQPPHNAVFLCAVHGLVYERAMRESESSAGLSRSSNPHGSLTHLEVGKRNSAPLDRKHVMQNQSAPEIRPHVEIINGSIRTTSPKVAEHFGRLHKDVLKAIKELDCSADFHQRNFAPMSIDVKIGNGAIRKSPAYEITRDGFTFLAMGFTGKEAARWKEAYINAFNQMEATLAKPQSALKDLRSRKALPGVLTLEQQDAIKALVKSRVDALPEDRRAKAAITCWSALKSKFGCSYKLIPPAQFGEALSLIARLDLGDASQDLLGAMRLANSPGALAGRRFLIRFSPGGDHYTASPVPEQAAVLTLRGFLRAIADPNGLLFPMDDTDLMFDAVESLQRMLRLRHAYFNRIGRA